MISSTSAFNAQIQKDSRTFRARLLNNEVPISGAIKRITINKGACGDPFSIGSVYSPYIEVTLDDCEELLENKELLLQIGLVIGDSIEYINIGYYMVTKPSRDERQTTFTAVGRINAKLNVLPKALGTQTIEALAQTITSTTGVPILFQDLSAEGTIEENLSGLTCKEILNVIATVLGGYATEDADGNVVICRFSIENPISYNGDKTIFPPEFNDLNYSLYGVKVVVSAASTDEDGNEIPEVSYTSGTPRMTLQCKYMTESLFTNFAENVIGYTFRPGTVPLALGDPRLEPWDSIEFTDINGKVYAVPCLNIVHTFDGGLTTTITAPGESESESSSSTEGPIAQQMEKLTADIVRAQEAILKRVRTDDLESEVAKLGYASIKELEAVNATIGDLKAKDAEITGKLTANDAAIENLKAKDTEITGLLTAANAEITNLKAKDVEITGTLTAATADITDLKAKDVEIEGTLTAATADITNLKAKDAEIEGTLKAANAEITNLKAKDVEITGQLTAVSASIGELEAKAITTENLSAKVGEFGYLKAKDLESEVGKFGYLKADDLEAEVGEFGYLKADDLEAEVAEFGYAKAKDLETTNLTVSNLSGDVASFKKATADNFTAANANITKVSGDFADYKTVVAGKFSAKDAEIEALEAKDAEIEELVAENLEATNAEIESLQAEDARIEGLFAGYATVGDLNATNADIEVLAADQAAFESATAKNFSAVNASIGEIAADYITTAELEAESAEVQKLFAGYATVKNLEATNANVTNLTTKQANFEMATADNFTAVNASINNIKADYVKTTELEAESADIRKLFADYATVENLNTTNGNIETLSSTVATINSAYMDEAEVNTLVAGKGYLTEAQVNTLVAGKGYFTEAQVDSLVVGKGYITTAQTNTLLSDYVKTSTLTADYIKASDIASTYATISNLNAANAKIDGLDATYATIDLANVEAGSITQAMIGNGVVGTAQIADGSITDAKIVGLTANKITAGTLDAGTIEVINLNAANITVGTINGQQIASGAIDTTKLTSSLSSTISTASTDATQALKDAEAAQKAADEVADAAEAAQKAADAAQEAVDVVNDVIVGTQTATTGSWTGVAKFSELKDGQSIMYWLPYAGSGNATLNLTLSDGTTTGAINCYYKGTTRLTTHFAAGSVVRLVYKKNVAISGSGSYTGWWADASYEGSNTYDRIRYQQAIKCGTTAIVKANIVVGSGGVYKHLKAGTAFDISYPILYASDAISASGTGTNNYVCIPFTVTTTQKITLTAYNPVYIKGTLSGTTFTPVSTAPLTQTAPTSEDGYDYILLGQAYSTTAMYLLPEHPIFKYYDGAFKSFEQIAVEAAQKATEAVNAAGTAQDTADGKNTVFYQASAPSTTGRKTNDIWFDTDDGNKMYYWNGSDWTAQQFGTNAIANAAITNALIADATIQSAKIANLDAGKITTGTLSADRIEASSIVAAKIASGAITTDKLGASAVTAGKIAADAITTDKIVTNAVTADKIAANAITANKILAGAITTDKVAAGAITATKISVDTLSALSANLGTVTAGVLQSENYQESNYSVSDDGTVTGEILEGLKIDLNNKAYYTPQITIKDNFINLNGYMTIGKRGTGDIGAYSLAQGKNVIASGLYSHAEGVNSKATAIGSHAEGSNTTASGDYSHAEGSGTATGLYAHAEGGGDALADYSHAEGWGEASGAQAHAEGGGDASGDFSHAEGSNTTASGDCSHAEGSLTEALGDYSHAEGYNTTAKMEYAHAEGCLTEASWEAAHAEGYWTTASGGYSHAEGQDTTASGQASHAEGYDTTASAWGAHAEGYYTKASGLYSHAEGRETEASDYQSHAEGYKTKATNSSSHAEGEGTIAASPRQHVQGKYNIADAGGLYAHIVGNGSSSALSNAHTLTWEGDAWYAGDISADGAISEGGTLLSAKYAAKSHTHSYLPLSGGTLSTGATIKLDTYGTRFLTISGNSISADMSKETGGWAGSFASVKDPSGTTTTMLGWYGGASGLTHIFMGGTYSDPALKMTGAGQFTFKNTPYVGSTLVSLANHTHNYAGSSSVGGAATTALACTGNAATATKLATARTISLTGSVTGSGTFDGSGNLSITTTTNHSHTLDYRLQAAQSTATGSDANSATSTGFHYINGTTNRPSFNQNNGVTGNDYRILTTAYSASWLQQIATDFRCDDIFYRRNQNGTWQAWRKLAFADEHLPLTGGTVSGNLILHADSGNSPKLIFERGDNTGSLTDWNIEVVSGNLIFNTVSASGSTASTQIAEMGYSGYLNVKELRENGTTLSSKYAAKSHTHSYLPLSGGTLTGDLTVGSASIGTNGYVTGTWLKTTANIALGSAATTFAVLSSGWIYSRTAAQVLSDIGAASASHTHSGYAKKENGVYYIVGTGSTEGTWLGSHDEITEYYDGLTILYKVGIAGVSGGTTLNINSLGATAVMRNASSAVTTHYGVNSVVLLTYTTDSGTGYWKIADYDANNYAYVRQYYTTANGNYPLLSKYDAGITTTTNYVTKYSRYSNKFYINPSTGVLTAPTFSGALSGNATSATKATQDGDGNVISSTYSKTTHTHNILHHTNGTSVVCTDYNSTVPRYYFRPTAAGTNPVELGSETNPWYKLWTQRIEITEGRIVCAPIYNNTVSSATNMYVNSSGTISRTTSTSSRTIKHDIKSLSADDIKAENLYDLDVVQFKYNDGIITDEKDARFGKTLPGFIIEDMDKVYSIAVDKPGDNVKEWSWNPQYMIPPMLKLIQDQHKEDIRMASEIDIVKAKLDSVQTKLDAAMMKIAEQEKQIEQLQLVS